MLYFYFHSVQCILKISCETSSLVHELFRSMFFSLHMFGIFLLYFCYSFLAWFHCGQRTHSVLPIFVSFLRFVLWARIWSILVYVPWVLERNMYSVVVGGRLYKCWWDPVGWWCCWVLLYPLYIADFIQLFYELLTSPTILVDLSFPPCSSVSFCFLYFASLLFGAYRFRIVMSFHGLLQFITMMFFPVTGNFLSSEV